MNGMKSIAGLLETSLPSIAPKSDAAVEEYERRQSDAACNTQRKKRIFETITAS